MEPKTPSPPMPYIILKGHVPWHGEPGYDVKGTRYTFRKRTLTRSFFDRPKAKRWLTTEGKISVPQHEHEAFMLEYWDWVDKQDRDARANGRIDSMDHGPTSVLADEGGPFREMEMEQEEQVLLPGLLSAMTNISRAASRGINRGHSNIPRAASRGNSRGHSSVPYPRSQGSYRGRSNITRPARPARPGTAQGQVQAHLIGAQRPLWADYPDKIPSQGIRRDGSGIIRPTHPENVMIPQSRQPQTLINEERPAWAGPPPNANFNPYAYLDGSAPLPLAPPTHGFTGYVPQQPSGNLYRNPFVGEPYPHSQYTPPTFQPSPQTGYLPPNFQPPPPFDFAPPNFQPLLQTGYMSPNFQPPPAGFTPPTFQPLLQAGYTPPNFQPPPPSPLARFTPPTFQPLMYAGYTPPTFQPSPQARYAHSPFQQPPQARYTATSGPLPSPRAPTHAPPNPNPAPSGPRTSISALGRGDQREHGRDTLNVSSPDSARTRQQERWDWAVEETYERDEPGSL